MKASARLREAISAPERDAAARVASLLSSETANGRGPIQFVDADGRRTDLPARLADIVQRAAALLAEGQTVTVLSEEEMLSIGAAADVLNVSRQYLLRLLDAGELPAVKTGNHRRLRASVVIEYKAARDAKRRSALHRLAELSEDVDGYSLGMTPR